MNQLTIGILVTNTDNSDFAARWPRDGEKFTVLMQAVRPQWAYRIYECTRGEFPSQTTECDGYLIGGSPASVNDSDPWIEKLMAFIRLLNSAKAPTVGCCFGHQAIAKALGGRVGKNPRGWGFGVAPTHFNAQFSWMQPSAKTLDLYAAHGEQVVEAPECATIIGGSDFCPTASLLVEGHFFTTEYHPEMTKEFFVALTHAFERYIGTEVAAKAREGAVKPADGLKFAEWTAKFLELPR